MKRTFYSIIAMKVSTFSRIIFLAGSSLLLLQGLNYRLNYNCGRDRWGDPQYMCQLRQTADNQIGLGIIGISIGLSGIPSNSHSSISRKLISKYSEKFKQALSQRKVD